MSKSASQARETKLPFSLEPILKVTAWSASPGHIDFVGACRYLAGARYLLRDTPALTVAGSRCVCPLTHDCNGAWRADLLRATTMRTLGRSWTFHFPFPPFCQPMTPSDGVWSVAAFTDAGSREIAAIATTQTHASGGVGPCP